MSHTPDLLSVAHRRLQVITSADRDGEDPTRPETVQAMPMVLHIPKASPPDRTLLLEAAARAVVEVCLDDRAGQDSAYAESLLKWYGARIRKVARRARNLQWERVLTLPGACVDNGGAQAAAFLPSAVDDTDPLLAKLQISGTDLPSSPQIAVEPAKPLIAVDASLQMSVGKAAAQVGHASMLLAAAMTATDVQRWADNSFELQIRELPREEFTRWAEAPGAVAVRDAGYTEVAPGSITAVGVANPCVSTKTPADLA